MSANAGDIVFKITGDDSPFQKALKGARANGMQYARRTGMAMTAVGATITAVAAKSVMDFAALGDEIGKTSTRMGWGAEQVSVFKHAAEQAGATLGDVEKANKRLNTVIFEAGQGTTSYVEALGALGLNYQNLQAMAPEERFKTVAFALGQVQDAGTRSALAVEIFGRAGTQLMPMLEGGRAGLAEMAAEARRLGIVFDDEMAASAEGLTDEMDEVKKSMTGVSLELAKALLPAIRQALPAIRDTIARLTQWAQKNPDVAAGIVKFVAAAGAVMTVLGPILIALPGIVAGFTAVKAVVVGVIAIFGALAGAVSAPVLAIVAAVAGISAAAYSLYANWEYVVRELSYLWNWLKQQAQSLWETMIRLLGVVKQFTTGGIIGGINSLVGAVGQGIAQQQVGGPQVAAATSLGGGGQGALGIGGGVTIQNMTIVSSDPEATSRELANNLTQQLAARGLA